MKVYEVEFQFEKLNMDSIAIHNVRAVRDTKGFVRIETFDGDVFMVKIKYVKFMKIIAIGEKK